MVSTQSSAGAHQSIHVEPGSSIKCQSLETIGKPNISPKHTQNHWPKSLQTPQQKSIATKTARKKKNWLKPNKTTSQDQRGPWLPLAPFCSLSFVGLKTYHPSPTMPSATRESKIVYQKKMRNVRQKHIIIIWTSTYAHHHPHITCTIAHSW